MERERGAALPLICLPVKADAYGHGALPIAKCALGAGVQYLAVATVDEGVQLREGGITAPILLFSQCIPQEMEAASKNGLLPLVGDKEAASLFALNGGKCVFLKIDSGMGRMGCAPCDACKTAEYINSLGLKINGTLTHLAVSDSSAASSIEYTNLQLKKFNAALEEMREVGLDSGIVSAANSGATAGFPASWFDMVRPGILLYGYAPKMYTEIPVKPVMELISQIVCIKKIKGGG
ncbi:MAG: hypothetical protein Ta2G_16860 [Termitinemataceae bacterium]|nr:MAG: hypothetical protein Ta2G_16860 [Termitinemataceae bacterium]